jgi:hypothetical protein
LFPKPGVFPQISQTEAITTRQTTRLPGALSRGRLWVVTGLVRAAAGSSGNANAAGGAGSSGSTRTLRAAAGSSGSTPFLSRPAGPPPSSLTVLLTRRRPRSTVLRARRRPRTPCRAGAPSSGGTQRRLSAAGTRGRPFPGGGHQP